MAIGLNIAVAITAALALTAQPASDAPNPDSVNPPPVPIMIDLPAAGDTGQHCSVDMGLCLAILNGDEGAPGPPQLQLRDPHPSGGADGIIVLPLPQSLAPEGRQSLSLWTRAIRLPGNPEEGEGNQSVLPGGTAANEGDPLAGNLVNDNKTRILEATLASRDGGRWNAQRDG